MLGLEVRRHTVSSRAAVSTRCGAPCEHRDRPRPSVDQSPIGGAKRATHLRPMADRAGQIGLVAGA